MKINGPINVSKMERMKSQFEKNQICIKNTTMKVDFYKPY